jgi:hypothetical protein
LWLLGIAVQIGGFAAHAVALRSGPLVTVQMLVSAELIVAVVIVGIWPGRPLGRACRAAALTVAAAVAAFLELTSPGHGHAAGQPGYAAAAGPGAAATGPARWPRPSRACVRPDAGARSCWPWRRGWRIPARRW